MPRAAAWLATALITLLTGSVGCASMQAARQREQQLRGQLDASRLRKPLDEVWPEVRRVLHDQHYALAAKDLEALGLDGPTGIVTLFSPAKETESLGPGRRSLETGWGPGVVRRRYRVEAVEESGGCRVTFIAIREDLTERGRDAQRERDVEMELMLTWRVDRDLAARIEAAVDPEAK